MRQCRNCGVERPEEEFPVGPRTKNNPSGRWHVCKSCKNDQARKRYVIVNVDRYLMRLTARDGVRTCTKCGATSDKVKFMQNSSFRGGGLKTICAPCHCAHLKALRANDNDRAEQLREKSRALYRANIEKIRAQTAARRKKYRSNNPEKDRACRNAWRVKKISAPGNGVTAADISRKMHEQNGLCVACGIDVTSVYHVDHIIPLSRGGHDDPTNIQILCPTCNMSKGAKLMEEWLAAA